MSKSESYIQREIMLAASEAGMTLWRNNVGKAWQGKRSVIDNADLIWPGGARMHIERGILLTDPRPVEFGLCPGSSDLIGLRNVRIVPKHVGTTIAQFIAIECKSSRGRMSSKQEQFLNYVVQQGGFGRLVRSIDDLLNP